MHASGSLLCDPLKAWYRGEGGGGGGKSNYSTPITAVPAWHEKGEGGIVPSEPALWPVSGTMCRPALSKPCGYFTPTGTVCTAPCMQYTHNVLLFLYHSEQCSSTCIRWVDKCHLAHNQVCVAVSIFVPLVRGYRDITAQKCNTI